MKKVIISGGNGFIGSALTKFLLEQNVEIVALTHNGKKNHLLDSPHITYLPFDLSNIEQVKTLIPAADYDVFYHLAWSGSAGFARTNVELQLNNANWAVQCLRLAKQIGCKRFVVAGSIMEHETMAATYTQGNQPGLGYIYGGGKLISHVMCMAVAADIGIDLVWAGITNAYGPGETSPRLINTTLRKCLNGENPRFTSGTQNYDFIYIDDVARAFYLIGQKGKAFHEYLIGSSTARPLKKFLLEMKDSVAPNMDFIFGDIPFTGINLPLSQFDCSATEADTGFRAEISFYEGTKRTMEWLKQEREK